MDRSLLRLVRGLLSVFTVGTTIGMVACVSEDPVVETISCESYCTAVTQACGGEKRQYRANDECLKACSFIDLGTAADGDINSIGCRIRKARSAKTKDDCVAAGPFGGGVCGKRCDTFCRMVSQNCFSTTAPPPYGGSIATCSEQCPSYRLDPSEGEGPDQVFEGNNSLNCRSFHLVLALASATDAETHCSHAGQDSPVCRR